jgi:nucleotide-binding universal stress UspA family protein
MTLTQNILVATDFSPASALALDAASILARQNGAKVTIMHVFEATPFAPIVEDPKTGSRMVEPDLREKIHAQLIALREDKFGEIERVKTALVVSDNAADGICHYAQKEDVDMIVVATHGRSGLAHLLIGSVAEKVVRHAPCPVLTLRSKLPD